MAKRKQLTMPQILHRNRCIKRDLTKIMKFYGRKGFIHNMVILIDPDELEAFINAVMEDESFKEKIS